MALGQPGPDLRDWVLFAIAILFVCAGVLILRSDPAVAICEIAFFGVCAGVFGLNIRRKLGYRLGAPVGVEVVGGVPIRPSRKRALGLGATLAGLGTVLVVFGSPMGLLFQGLGGFIGAVGYLLLAGVVLGWWPAGFIRFDPSGFTIGGRRWTCLVPWDDMAGVGSAEYHGNPALLIGLVDEASVAVEPPERAADVQRYFARNARWMGAPIAIMSSNYGIDLLVLQEAVLRYVDDPAARAELSRRHLA